MRKAVPLLVALGALWLAPSAGAAIGSVFPVANGSVSCSVDGTDAVRECGSSAPRSTTKTWDGTPLDVNVAFPPDPGSPDGPYPLIMVFHGYGGQKIGFGAPSTTGGLRRWTSRGYAVLTMTDRGFHESCGSAASQAADPVGCAHGYVRLLDTRYEVRDAQFLAGELVDEGLVDPQRIGATGGSYGGGMSMALAALKDRTMLPNGSLVPWRSPVGNTPLRIAAATPEVPWTDLAYALTPNGHNLDFVADSPYRGRFGIEKQSFVNGLYLSGQLAPGFYAATGSDPSADLTGWRNRLAAGEPYDGDPTATAILSEIKAHHSSYYIDHSEAPAPLLISNGVTDDLFPVDEAVRFYNRTRTQYPSAPIALTFGDFGHQRAATTTKPDIGTDIVTREDAWMDHYVKGVGTAPPSDVEGRAETCPGSAPSGPMTVAPNWAKMAAFAEVRFAAGKAKVIKPGGGSDAISAPFNPSPSGTACSTAPAADQSGVATYRLPAASGGGYTLRGSPTIIARIKDPKANSQLAARLLDVDPHGTANKADDTETLVARQLYRPKQGTGTRVFQLHPGFWHFADGHIAKLELLPRDYDAGFIGGYGRASNGQGTITVSHLQLKLPVGEAPGAAGGAVKRSSPRVAPCTYRLARDFRSLGRVSSRVASRRALRARRGRIAVKVDSVPGDFSCRLTVTIKGLSNPARFVIARRTAKVGGGQTKVLKLGLTRRARHRLLGRRARIRTRVVVKTKGVGRTSVKRPLRLPHP